MSGRRSGFLQAWSSFRLNDTEEEEEDGDDNDDDCQYHV